MSSGNLARCGRTIWAENATTRMPSRCASSTGHTSGGPSPREARCKKLFPLMCWQIHPGPADQPSGTFSIVWVTEMDFGQYDS
jgi:hypothetical protein